MRREALLLLTVLLLAVPPFAAAQVTVVATPTGLGLGFGPNSIEPIGVGVPVMEAGDTLWAESYLTQSTLDVSLLTPQGMTVIEAAILPGAIVPIYTFPTATPVGKWVVSVSLFATYSFVDMRVVSPTAPITPTLTQGNISKNFLDLSYSLPPTGAASIQACAMGSETGSSALLPLPKSAGDIGVNLTGSGVAVSGPAVPQNLSAWFELYSPRYFVNGTTTVSEGALAAQTGVVAISGGPGVVNIPLAQEMNMRPGRYDLRSFFRDSSGLVPFDTPYLRTLNGTWISLGGCTQLEGVVSGSFVIRTDLDKPTATWPRSLYLMYSSGGVDSFTVTSVPQGEARIQISNLNGTLNPSAVSATVTGFTIGAWDYYNSSVYLIGEGFPIQAGVSISFDGVTSRDYVVTIPGPYQQVPLRISAGGILVEAVSHGSPLANLTVSVSVPGSPPARLKTSQDGTLDLTLPPGEYNLTSVYLGTRASLVHQVSSGAVYQANMDLTPSGPPLLLYLLAAVLAAAAVADVLIWKVLLRRKALKGRGTGPSQPSRTGNIENL